MSAEHGTRVTAVFGEGADIHRWADTSSGESRVSGDPGNVLLSVPEAASLLHVGVRTVWRLMADPRSKFPKPRRLRGRTLLVREELLAFLDLEEPR
jgi:excisionase family DNA binding protein